MIGEDLGVTAPVGDGLERLLGVVLRHVIAEFVTEPPRWRLLTRPVVEHPSYVPGQGHEAQQMLRKELQINEGDQLTDQPASAIAPVLSLVML